MIHQPLGGAQGQATDIQIQAKEILTLFVKSLNQILADPYRSIGGYNSGGYRA